MARLSISLIVATILLSVGKQTCCADLEAVDINALEEKVKRLGTQIKAAEDGEQEAKKLLEDGKARQLSFENEIQNLRANIANRDITESTLQQQVTLLQEESKKLKVEEEVHRDLKAKFDIVSNELQATKDTLANTLAQLAEKSNTATQAESGVLHARQALEEAKRERDAIREKLQLHEKGSVDIQQELEAERALSKDLQSKLANREAQVENLSQEKDQLSAENSGVKEELLDLQKTLNNNDKQVSDLQSKVERAEKAVKSAEATLEKALKEHSATQAALIQAESKAEEAMRKMELLLTAWLPHWLDDRYQQLRQAVDPAVKKVQPAVQKVQPALNNAWKQFLKYSELAQNQVRTYYRSSKAKSQAAWKQAKPTLDRQLADLQKLWKKYSSKSIAAVKPFLQRSWSEISKKYIQISKQISNFIAQNPQLSRLRRSLSRTIRDLENLTIRYLKQVPALKAYAKRPEVTYLVWAVLSAPLITILLPLLLTRGDKKKPANLETSNIAHGRGEITPEPKASKPASKSKKDLDQCEDRHHLFLHSLHSVF